MMLGRIVCSCVILWLFFVELSPLSKWQTTNCSLQFLILMLKVIAPFEEVPRLPRLTFENEVATMSRFSMFEKTQRNSGPFISKPTMW